MGCRCSGRSSGGRGTASMPGCPVCHTARCTGRANRMCLLHCSNHAIHGAEQRCLADATAMLHLQHFLPSQQLLLTARCR